MSLEAILYVTMSTRVSIDQRKAEAMEFITRLIPSEALRAQRKGAAIIDTRDSVDRFREGAIPDALVITRNTLEWRCDPDAELPMPELANSFDRHIIIVCNDGYSSILAAKSLVDLGHQHVSDLKGGYRAWKREGLDIVDGRSIDQRFKSMIPLVVALLLLIQSSMEPACNFYQAPLVACNFLLLLQFFSSSQQLSFFDQEPIRQFQNKFQISKKTQLKEVLLQNAKRLRTRTTSLTKIHDC